MSMKINYVLQVFIKMNMALSKEGFIQALLASRTIRSLFKPITGVN